MISDRGSIGRGCVAESDRSSSRTEQNGVYTVSAPSSPPALFSLEFSGLTKILLCDTWKLKLR